MQAQDNTNLNMSVTEEPLEQWLSVRGIKLLQAPKRVFYADTADGNTYQEAKYEGSFRDKWVYWLIYQHDDPTSVYITLKTKDPRPTGNVSFPVLYIYWIDKSGVLEQIDIEPELLEHYTQTDLGATYKLELKKEEALVRMGNEAVRVGRLRQMT